MPVNRHSSSFSHKILHSFQDQTKVLGIFFGGENVHLGVNGNLSQVSLRNSSIKCHTCEEWIGKLKTVRINVWPGNSCCDALLLRHQRHVQIMLSYKNLGKAFTEEH